MTTTRTHKIAVIKGDGIGGEVIPAGIAAIEAAARGSDVSFSFTELPWGCDYYIRHHRMMDEDGFDRVASFDAIYLGAIGDPKMVASRTFGCSRSRCSSPEASWARISTRPVPAGVTPGCCFSSSGVPSASSLLRYR